MTPTSFTGRDEIMSCSNQSKNQNSPSFEFQQKLMVTGSITSGNSSAPFEVKRGMPICSREGWEVGKVAAVVLDGNKQKAVYLLLGRLPETSGYWMVSVDLIAEVDDEKVQLSIPREAVQSLPEWHSS
jgi:sporulation protein YlmC with PRC-barrel domain